MHIEKFNDLKVRNVMNGNKTLIAYATKSGVTEENANIIASVLRDTYKLEVDIINLKKIKSPDLSPYKNVIIGSGIRIGRWYKKAKKFLKNDFKDKKVAIYLSSLEAGDPKSRDQAIKKYIEEVLAKYTHIKPVATEAFGGRAKIFKTVTDSRDVEKVKEWANELGKKFKI